MSTGLAAAVLQLFAHARTDVLFGNLIFQPELVEQRFRAVVLPITISRPPTIGIKQSMGGCFLLTRFCSISSGQST